MLPLVFVWRKFCTGIGIFGGRRNNGRMIGVIMGVTMGILMGHVINCLAWDGNGLTNVNVVKKMCISWDNLVINDINQT
jgi:hypothetical protein